MTWLEFKIPQKSLVISEQGPWQEQSAHDEQGIIGYSEENHWK